METNTTNLINIEKMKVLCNETDQVKVFLAKFSNLMQVYYMAFIVIVGIIGNLLTIIIFSSEKKLIKSNIKDEIQLRKKSKMVMSFSRNDSSITSIFVVGLAISDLGYNLVLVLVWGSYANLFQIIHYNVICQLSIYLTYVFSFLSAAFTTLFTFQRFMAVVKPLKSATSLSLRSTHLAKRVILAVIVISGLVYFFSLFVHDTELKHEHACMQATRHCGVSSKFSALVYTFDNTIDSFLTLILPSFAIVIMNISICQTLARNRRQNLSHFQTTSMLIVKIHNLGQKPQTEIVESSKLTRSSTFTLFKNLPNGNEEEANKTRNTANPNNNRLICKEPSCRYFEKRIEQTKRITQVLVIISFVFILFNMPFRVSKLVTYIRMIDRNDHIYSNLEYAVNVILINLFFTSYSVNFFLYSFGSKKFRCVFKILIFRAFNLIYSKLTALFGVILHCRQQ